MIQYLTDVDHLNLDEGRGQEYRTKEDEGNLIYRGGRKLKSKGTGKKRRMLFKKELEERFEEQGYKPDFNIALSGSEKDFILDLAENSYVQLPNNGEVEGETEIISNFPEFVSNITESLESLVDKPKKRLGNV